MKVSKNKNLLFNILKKADFPKTSLVKLSYLIDLISVRRLKSQISDFTYIRKYYGPYDSKINVELEALQKDGIVTEVGQGFKFNGDEVLYYSLISHSDDFNLSSEELEIVESVLSQTEGMSAKELTEISYATAPLKKFGATLGGSEHLFEELDMNAL